MTADAALDWQAPALEAALGPLRPGLRVEVVAQIGSTNTELVERARRSAQALRTGDPHGGTPAAGGAAGAPVASLAAGTLPACLLVAESQTAGRGRQGKAWQSRRGASLTFSLALPYAPADWSGLSLAVGLSLAETLDPPRPGEPPRLGLKWPNDLLLRGGDALGRKLGGILIETVPVGPARLVVIGIGLNVRPQPVPDGLAWGLATVHELHPGLEAPQLLARVAPPLLAALADFEQHGFAPLVDRYARRDLLRGQAVSTTLPQVPQGQADGVDEQGMLWLRTPTGRVPVGSGEVSLRPPAAPAPRRPDGEPAC